MDVWNSGNNENLEYILTQRNLFNLTPSSLVEENSYDVERQFGTNRSENLIEENDNESNNLIRYSN